MIRNDLGHATRFLQRATFGPRHGDVEQLQTVGADIWLDDQMSMTDVTDLFDMLGADSDERLPSCVWRAFLSHGDQLRLRMGYALSQIFVVSEKMVGAERGAGFFDMLSRHAFGNFRDLLEDVALSPAMGRYLSHHRNAPANARTGSMPDENFAREIMQLFTVGLWDLHDDGSQKLRSGQPIPTYDNDDVMGLARCFTGWESEQTDSLDRYRNPMIVWEPTSRWHEHGEKRFLGTVIESGTGARESLRIALDTLFRHPNTAPFISRQLIQRLVTSNPSRRYVRRVTAVFEDNGEGTRGDLAAVCRAVLLDPEAFEESSNETSGKIREPALRFSIVLRMLGVDSSVVPWNVGDLSDAATGIGQQPMRAPSVFNFYRPGFVPPGSDFADGGYVSPEMQIVDEVSSVGWINRLARTVKWSPVGLTFDFADLEALADEPESLVDEVALRLCPNGLRAATRSIAVRAIERTQHHYDDLQRRERALGCVVLVAASTDFIYER